MQLFIEEHTSAFFNLTVLLQQIFWHSPFKPSYVPRPIIEEYFLAFLHLEKWAEEPIFDRWIDTIGGQHDQKYRSIASVSIHQSIADYVHLWLRWPSNHSSISAYSLTNHDSSMLTLKSQFCYLWNFSRTKYWNDSRIVRKKILICSSLTENTSARRSPRCDIS
jgi:hypothetical protein